MSSLVSLRIRVEFVHRRFPFGNFGGGAGQGVLVLKGWFILPVPDTPVLLLSYGLPLFGYPPSNG